MKRKSAAGAPLNPLGRAACCKQGTSGTSDASVAALGCPSGGFSDDFGVSFPTMLTDFRSTLDGFLSMVLDDFLTK